MTSLGKSLGKNSKGAGTVAKTGGNKTVSCAQRIEQATVHRTQVSMTENMVQDAEALFRAHDSEGTELLSRGALTELLRQVGLEAKMGDAFGATARLAFDAHSADSHFLSLPEFKQLYYVVNQRHPGLLPRTPFLKIFLYSASGLPPADYNGKSDPFVVLQIAGKPQSKSSSSIVEKTLDPVWNQGRGEEFYDKYAYEEGDALEFVVNDYDKGCTDFEVLGKGKLLSSDFHKPGGFHGAVQLTCPPDCPKGYAPTLKVKIVVNALEMAAEANRPHTPGQHICSKTGLTHFKAGVSAVKATLVHQDDPHGHEHATVGGEGAAPAGA
jgi:hypothetical protein